MKKEEKILQDHEIAAIAQKLRPHLDRAVEQVAPHIASRLGAARQAAVAAVATRETQTASNVIANGNTLTLSGRSGWGDRLSDWRFWATGFLVAAAIAMYAGNEWRETVNARDAADVELMILGDDVPVDALLDKGFGSFLREENK
jgi:Protein of unknown function (DUF3619)